ncbi:hypothetical protein [Turicibacter sanguinis]|uniref:hypothetical protein n=1 Tax=Turicibacter sanguinis TaxID=154288 RepID=UPI0018AA0ABE|nr:hypothetical protein [Turicibacter sanguinis]MDB8553914.1 hypothetical protein [Turicibacter sanguinis]
MRQKIVDALTPLNIELAWSQYTGDAEDYIIFSVYNNAVTDECDNSHLSEIYYVTISYWFKSLSNLKKEKQIKKSMLEAGFAFDGGQDLVDGNMKGISMDFIMEIPIEEEE